MAGLMQNPFTKARKAPTLGANVYSADSTGYDPATRTVDAATETMAGQMAKLTAKESGLMTQARTKSAQQANARGLLNSSLALEAGESAAMNAALPIAQFDAGVYDLASRENTAAKNRAFEFSAAADNTAALTDANAANQFSLTNLTGDIQSRQIREQGEQTRLNQGQMGEIESGLIGRRGEQDRLNIGATGAENRLTQAQAGQIQERMAQLQAALQTGLIGEEGRQTRLTAAQAQQAQQELARLEAQLQTGIIGAQGAQQRQTQAEAAAQERQLFGMQAAQQTAMQQLVGQQNVSLQQMQDAAAKDRLNIEAEYKNLMQTNASAAQVMATAQDGINRILENKDLSNEAKAALIQKANEGLRAQMGVIGAMSGLDLSSLLNFPTTPITQGPSAQQYADVLNQLKQIQDRLNITPPTTARTGFTFGR